MCMKPAHTLNTWKVHTWAQVAQAVTWDDYALNSDGQVTVKATRGPVIVWGKRTGEGEDVPRFDTPTPSPLEVAAARVNIQAHALAFARAAHGKVRHSVRWRMRWAQRVKRVAQAFLDDGEIGECGQSVFLARQSWLRRRLSSYGQRRQNSWQRKLAWLRVNRGRSLGRFDIYRADEYWLTIDMIERFDIRYSESGHPILDRFLENSFKVMEITASSSLPDEIFYKRMSQIGINDETLNHATFLKQFKASAAIARFLRLTRTRFIISHVVARRAAYRAHIARRVRPVSRRARVPRPLYARPRPPTCPLAPPVTC